jgi:hypothetical protein
VATHSITGVYSGDVSFTASTSAVLTQTVNKASTNTTMASSANPSVTGQTVTYTATVAAVAPGSGTATGTVAFKDGVATIGCTGGTQTLNGSGIATCQFSNASMADHSITAVYLESAPIGHGRRLGRVSQR